MAHAEELDQSQIRHIGKRFPGRFGRPIPSVVASLAAKAKTYFVTTQKSAVKVLDALEEASKLRLQDVPDHVITVQMALGGKPDTLVDIGSFVKCPVQMEYGKVGAIWRMATCSCHLQETDPFAKEVKEILRKEKSRTQSSTES
jgi:hypothetical protein